MSLRKMIFSFILLLLMTSSKLVAQASHTGQYLGFGYNLATSVHKTNNQTSLGLVYENRFTNSLGIETGLYTRNFYYSLYKNRHIEIPVLLKFYSNAVNLSVGVSGGFFAGSESYYDNVDITDNNKYNVSVIAKAGHDFYLSESLIIEPEVVVIPFTHIDNKEVSVGLGVKLKYFF